MSKEAELEKKLVKLEKEVNTLREEKKAREEKESKDQNIVQSDVKRLEILVAQQKALGEYNNAKQTEIELRKRLKDLDELSVGNAERLEELRSIEKKDLSDLQKEELSSLERLEQKTEYYKQLADELTKNTEGVRELSNAEKEAKSSFDDSLGGFAQKIGLNSAAYNNFSNGVVKFTKLMTSGTGQFRKSLEDTFSVQKVGGAMLMQMFEATMQLAVATEKATVAFAASTGAGRVMTAQISETANEFRNIGMNAESAGKAATDLFNGFTGFMSVNKETQKQLMATVGSLGRLGIDGETATKTLTLFNKNMGMSLSQSQKLTKQLAVMGTKIGISSSQMVKGFAEASKSLAVYGKDAIKVFTDLAAQAKAANVETSTLLGIAEKFDTFSGAADAAGKLNSILGTQISATDMLTMKENERIETLIRSMQQQGRSFKDMDRFSQKAVAAAAGINDMAEAQRIFGMSVSEYRKGMQVDPAEEEFQKNLKDTMSIMEKLEKIAQQFAISIAPLLDGIASFLQGVLDANQALGGVLVPGLAMLFSVAIGLPKLVGIFTTFMGLFSGGLAKKAGKGMEDVAESTGSAATKLSKAVPKIMKHIGKGIKTFASAIAKAAPKLLKGAIGLLAVGAAFVAFGFGISMMGEAFGGDMSFGTIFGFFSGLSLGLIVLAASLAAIGGVILGTGFLGGAALAMGVAAMAGSILALGLAISTLNLEKITAVNELISNLTGGGDVTIGFSAVADLKDFTNQLVEKEATLKPMLGDLALITTGKTTQSITTSTVDYSINTFAAKFENTFKPNVTVKIGNEEFKDFVIEAQAEGSR